MVMKLLASTHKKSTLIIAALFAVIFGAGVIAAPAASALTAPNHTILAQDISEGDEQCSTKKAPTKGQGSNCVVKHIIRPFLVFLTSIAAVLIVIQLIAGGIQYSSAGGDPSKVAEARKRISNAIFTLAAFIFLWAFLQYLIPGGITQ